VKAISVLLLFVGVVFAQVPKYLEIDVSQKDVAEVSLQCYQGDAVRLAMDYRIKRRGAKVDLNGLQTWFTAESAYQTGFITEGNWNGDLVLFDIAPGQTSSSGMFRFSIQVEKDGDRVTIATGSLEVIGVPSVTNQANLSALYVYPQGMAGDGSTISVQNVGNGRDVFVEGTLNHLRSFEPGVGIEITQNAQTLLVGVDTDALFGSLQLQNISGVLPLAKGGTGSLNANDARVALGVPSEAELQNHTLNPGIHFQIDDTEASVAGVYSSQKTQALLDGKADVHAHPFEPQLGNPAEDGMVLSSDTAGNRSWVNQSGGSVPLDIGVNSVFSNSFPTSMAYFGNDSVLFSSVGRSLMQLKSFTVDINPNNHPSLDFRVRSAGGSYNIYADSGLDRVGIGTGDPTSRLDVDGGVTIRGGDSSEIPAGKFTIFVNNNRLVFAHSDGSTQLYWWLEPGQSTIQFGTSLP